MFGKGRDKSARSKRDHAGKNLAQYGLFDIPTDLNNLGNMQDDEGDSDLEAELAALSGSGGSKPKPKKQLRKPIPQAELDALVADSIKDIPSDDEDIDENDPELLSELNDIVGSGSEDESPSQVESIPKKSSSNTASILNERLNKYEIAQATAESAGETGKARRYGRAIKTLKDLVKQANAGKDINLEDESVPPEIQVEPKAPRAHVPVRPAPEIPQDSPAEIPSEHPPEVPSSPVEIPQNIQENVTEIKKEIDEELLNMLLERQKEYKIAAIHAKKSGESETALKYVKIAKQFEHVVAAVRNGQPVDLSKMPGPPGEVKPKIEANQVQKSDIPDDPIPSEVEITEPPALITASSILEALEQHLQVYKDHETKAKEEGNNSKARRYGRIIKQFEQAIKAQKAGKPVDYEELPTPPGYAAVSAAGAPPAPAKVQEMPRKPEAEGDDDESKSLPKASPSRISGNHSTTSHIEKQVLILQAKQKQFKLAALNAKKKGELNEAKEFLKQAKGFDKLIDAARGGLPIDWSSIPVSPEARSQLDNEYDIVMSEECTIDNNTDQDILTRLENQLTKQLKMCLTTRDHNKALGDVAGMNRFERLAMNVTKDLDVIRLAKKTSGGNIPKFHYEMRDFSIVKSFTELMDNDLELCVVRGINYQSTNPKEIDTYVKFEFPFPQEEPYSSRTSTVKDTNNPEYNQTFTIPIQRNSRHCQRVFKRHGIKLEIYSKGCYCCGASDIFTCFSGFFRGDTLIGTVNVKLQALETQCELHDSFDLLEGRRKVGGKLEVRLRLRNPIVTQQVEQIQEKWLVIDN